MMQDMTEPNVEPSTFRNKLLSLIAYFVTDAGHMTRISENVATDALPDVLDRHMKQTLVETRDAGELKGLNEAARDIGVLKTFDKAADARAAIKEQYAKLQEKREKDMMSTPDLLLEAASILGDLNVDVTKNVGFQVLAGGKAAIGTDRSLREAMLSALKKAEESKLTMKQHLAIKALVEKAVG